MSKVDVSIIIVSFNTRDLLLDCIHSVIKFTKNVSYELIVIDNDSKDGSVAALKKEFKTLKNLKVISNTSNLGFAEANNQGFKVAEGEYLLLLNSDTYFIENVLSKTFRVFEDPKVGIASCQLLNKDRTIQPSGGYFPTPLRLLWWLFFIDDLPVLSSLLSSFHPKSTFFKKSHPQDWVTGAFFLIRKQCFDEVGEFSTDYFMYTEEMDYCYRAKKLGWGVWFEAQTAIIHLGQASGSSEYALTQEMRNVRLFIRKYHSSQYRVSYYLVKAGVLFRSVVFGILGKKSLSALYQTIYAKTQYAL